VGGPRSSQRNDQRGARAGYLDLFHSLIRTVLDVTSKVIMYVRKHSKDASPL
jgi:hypothetical protein